MRKSRLKIRRRRLLVVCRDSISFVLKLITSSQKETRENRHGGYIVVYSIHIHRR